MKSCLSNPIEHYYVFKNLISTIVTTEEMININPPPYKCNKKLLESQAIIGKIIMYSKR